MQIGCQAAGAPASEWRRRGTTVVDLPGKTVDYLGLVELLAAATGSVLRLYGRDGLRGRSTIRGAGTDLLQMANGVIEQRLGE